MKVLVFWDIYGRLGRKAFSKEIQTLKEKYSPDFIVANIENITSGRWPVDEHARFVSDHGVDVMTSWDHIYDNSPSIDAYLKKDNTNLIRPANFYSSWEYELLGPGYKIVEKDGKKLLVLQLMGEVFMSHKVENPFFVATRILESIPEEEYDGVIVDFHRETTAELYGMAHYLDGKVSLVYGTHTHIQTNDAHVLPQGTWIIADVGMNGPFNSVIWADFQSVKKRFLTGIQRGKIEQQLAGPYIVNALYIEIDASTKMCKNIENISYTGSLDV